MDVTRQQLRILLNCCMFVLKTKPAVRVRRSICSKKKQRQFLGMTMKLSKMEQKSKQRLKNTWKRQIKSRLKRGKNRLRKLKPNSNIYDHPYIIYQSSWTQNIRFKNIKILEKPKKVIKKDDKNTPHQVLSKISNNRSEIIEIMSFGQFYTALFFWLKFINHFLFRNNTIQTMLYVETNNMKDQAFLEEQYNRDGSLFGVPYKKTKPIEQHMETIKFQVFIDKKQDTKNTKRNKHTDSLVVQKIMQLLIKFLNNTICFNTLREIFKLIRHHQQKLDLYEEHILYLNRLLMEEQLGSERSMNLEELEIDGMFQDLLQPKIRSVMTLESQLNFQEASGSKIDKTITAEKNSKPFHSLQQIQQENLGVKGFQCESSEKKGKMHSSSLRLEIPQTPLFKDSLEEILATKKQHSQRKFIDSSFQGDESSEYQQQVIETKRYSLSYDTTTNQTLYYPSWRKESDEQKRILQQVLNQKNDVKKNMSREEFLQNLSGRFKPMPSILNDNSIEDIIKREKKQDIRKSNILKQSMRGFEGPYINEKLYHENIKMVKFQHKINKKMGQRISKSPKIHKKDDLCVPTNQQPQKQLRKVKSNDDLKKITQKIGNNPITPSAGMLGSITSFFKFKKSPINIAPSV